MVGVVNQTIKDGIGQSRVADSLKPLIDWQLAGHKGGAATWTPRNTSSFCAVCDSMRSV